MASIWPRTVAVGLGGEVEAAGHGLDALGPHAHLRGGLLPADVQHRAPRARPGGPRGDVEQQGRLPDAGLAGHRDHGAGTMPPRTWSNSLTVVRALARRASTSPIGIAGRSTRGGAGSAR